ncbi:uncharacterized protein ARMOST_06437 [Armillaria ostoyae]|uniref:UvrD-like helicase ATP-binding domain-containing protein n=1 Tax=Armillaria ostoyae TaxID=47428 RepID=A0A284R2Z1_ARMOS|nr:uncharacterized protein ARMOST_06437 [Armillaria ostoyae]
MSRKRMYRSDLFSTEQLTSTDALESALQELQSVLTKDNFKHVFQELIDNESPNVLLLVLSSLSEAASLTSWLLESFPAEATNYEATVHYKAISCLSTELVSFPFVEDKALCARYHEVSQATPMALKHLISFLHPIDIGSEQKGKAKQSRRKDDATAFVERYFNVLDVDIPRTSGQASLLVDHVLQSQKDTLKFYLELVCHSDEMSTSLKKHFMGSAASMEEKITSGSVVEVPSAYPTVQPMKSALYFDTAEGFGDWTVVISTNTDNFLRSAHRKDPSTFNIAVKKIKELSCGHFTDNNQRRLSGSMTEVPVFEAKITRNLRLIYQIDIIPGNESREKQAIKIFVANSAKKDESIEKVRNHADQASKDAFYPASFPPLPEALPSEIEDMPDLRPEETAQIHSRLVIEKYVTFSQPFLNTILADVDATFPHMVSSQEKRIIEHPKSCYVIGRSGTGKTTTILFKMLLIERTFQVMESGLPHPRQVFITKSRTLARKVQEYFAKLASSLAVASQLSVDPTNLTRAPQCQDDLGLIDVDDVVDWRMDLPCKYSELEPKHFPLFITYDGLCEMLEADVGAQMSTTTSPISSHHNESHMGVITFESFCESYWPHFPASLVKGLDPAFVFSEIIGVIKGSTETLREENRHLNKATYLDLFTKRQQSSTFADQRYKVYKLFELYMRRKKLRGEYDAGDRILKYFTEHGTPHQGLDHLYVDEVQDHMLIDAMVLRALCSNANGLLWAGDTAQTISVGSSFSFNALKSFQWNIEDQYRRKRSLAAQQPPETFQLTVNYRSHAGIVDCAHSIIDLITTFWKDSVDRLSPEMGIVDGVKPVFFNNESGAQLEQFIFGDGGDHIEFGAQQCIIVRNEVAREKLRQQVDQETDGRYYSTIYESKGLEFNDVLLYNFFADSPAGLAQWRVVLNAVEESKQDPRNPPPQFDHIRHASICNELKSLYVAITRARENIWIADGSEAGEPMRTFWTHKDLISNYARGSDVPHLASSSTPEEWATEGRKLFNAKHFSQAKHCYNKAKLPFLASIADAYDLRAKARKVIEAAHSFFECAKASTNSKDSVTYLRISGQCFEQADQKRRAAQVFVHAREYTHAANLYRDIGKLDEAVAIVKSHADEMQLTVVQNVIKLARFTYFYSGQMRKAHQLFDSFEEEAEYLKERDLDVALADLLETTGRVCEAAELHCSVGRREVAIELFLREADNKDALRRAEECILEELWRRISFGVDSHAICSDSVVLRLMRFASQLDTNFMERTKASELSMFTAILQDQASRLRELALEFHNMGHSSAALLCLDQHFSRAFRIQNMDLVDAVEELSLFHIYVNLLSAAAYRIDPCQDVSTATLFGFQRTAANGFLVPRNTWLHTTALQVQRFQPKSGTSDSGFTLSAPELRGIFQRFLRLRLQQRIDIENDECARSKAFQLCRVFAVLGFCRRPDCPEAHVSASVVDAGYYNMRVRLHLQQILILQSFGENSEFWLNRLYEAVYPPHHVFGSISDLDLSTIPEAARAVNVVKDWVRTLTYRRAFYPNTTSRMDVMRATTLALIFDQSQADCLGNVAYLNACTPPMYVRRGGSSILLGPLAATSGTYIRLSDKETVRWEEEFVDVIPLRDMTFTAPEPTEREIAAASLIQRVYRKVLRRRRVTAKRGKAALHAEIYASCTKEVSWLGDNPGRYLYLFLGPLPHILVCLETVRIDTLSQRKKTQDKLQACSHNEYDVLDDQLIQITYALPALLLTITDTTPHLFNSKAYKAAVKLQQQLDPSSMFHERCDSKELRKLVEEATDLVSSLPFRTSLNLSDDLHLAHKGILAERSPAGKLKKPALKIRR